MHRLLTGRLVIATHNPGKLREMRDLLEPFPIEGISAADLRLSEPDESGVSFLDNASIKARAAAKAAGLPALADDSGICVDALHGQPGIHSARWAGEKRDFAAAMTRIEHGLRHSGALNRDQRRAHFVSALVLAWPDGREDRFEGKVSGTLVWPPRGTAGFGYDPIFLPDGHTRTFGEMTAEEKHGIPSDGSVALSHRARAFQQLAAACLHD